jgi:hypothetical protein
MRPWDYRWSSCPAYALAVADPLLSYNVWYQSLGADAGQRQQRWREFLLGDDPHEELVRGGNWIVGDEAFRRRMQQSAARPARRRGRSRKAPHNQEGVFSGILCGDRGYVNCPQVRERLSVYAGSAIMH